jgi:hypothetical protein
MAQRLTFLGRLASRWRVRIEVPHDEPVVGLTVGLWGEDGRPLAPSVVVPHGGGGTVEAELGGPAALPAGAEVRCIADWSTGESVVVTIGTDRRRGLHAFLHGDLRLPVSSDEPTASALTQEDVARLARAYPWLADRSAGVTAPTAAPSPASPPSDDLLDLLRDEFGVDVDDMDEDLAATLRGPPRS